MSSSTLSPDELKATTLKLFEASNASWSAASPFFTPDATFHHSRLGPMPFSTLAKQGEIVARNCTEPLILRCEHLIAEGRCVAAEYTSHAVLVNGDVYDQRYHFKLFFDEQGLVKEVHEYADTLKASQVWGKLMNQATVAAAAAEIKADSNQQ